MKKVLRMTKVTRLIKVYDILQDMISALSDEELLDKYALTFRQLEKVYAKLFHGGFLSRAQMLRRIDMRYGRDASHIPFAEIREGNSVYQCELCGYTSAIHFSTCPRCRQVNLRRLTRDSPCLLAPLSAGSDSAGS
jgi:hypothetical protein